MVSMLPSGFTLMKLKEGIERFLITDINNPAGSARAQSNVATMWDHWTFAEQGFSSVASYNHIPGGSNVLWMDGHVEFVKQGAKYPFESTQGAVSGNMSTPAGAAYHMGQIQASMGGNYNP